MSKKDIISVVVVLVILITISLYYFRGIFISADGDPWQFVSDETAMVIELDHPKQVYTKFMNNSELGNSIQSIVEVDQLINSKFFLDSLLSHAPVSISKLTQYHLLVVLSFDTTNQQVQTVFISHIAKHLSLSEIKHFLSKQLGKQYAVLENKILGHTTLKLINGQDQTVKHLGYRDGNLLFSNNIAALTQAYSSADKKNNHFTTNADWKALKASTGKKVDGRLYLQYAKLSPWIKSISNQQVVKSISWLSQFARWTETDLIIKKDELLLSGFTSSTNGDFLSSIKNQQPVTIGCYNLTPFNANLILSLGYSNFSTWFIQNKSTTSLQQWSATFNFDMSNIAATVGNEVALVSNAETSNNYHGNTWVLLHSNDKNKLATYLRRIAKNTGNTKAKSYNNHTINRITGSTFLPGLFGKIFPAFNHNYYTIIDNYAVFANSENSLINLLRFYETGKTIDLNDNFKVFSDNLSSQSNILLYFKPGKLMGRLTDFTNQFTTRKLQIEAASVNQFQGVALQYSTGKKLAYTNFYIKQATEVREENLALWKVQLDNNILNKPLLVNNHREQDQNILVFDSSPAIYLINSEGHLLWKKRIEGKPMGNIFEVDYYKNGKIQYLFNTSTHLYLFDVNGNNVANYPKKLHLSATNPLSLFDYTGARDYRIVLAQSDKKVNNFTMEGREVKGWNKPHLTNIVSEPITRLVINKKDYIIITDIEGKVKIVDRRGKERIAVSRKFVKARNSGYYINKTNSKGIIITTNNAGKLVYLSATGKIKTTDFGTFSPDHFFLYEDFNGDRTKDFIYIDGRELTVFDRFKKKLFQYTFDSEIHIKPEFFNLGRKDKVLGVVANDEKTIYLFDSKGNTIISTGLVGETPFTVGSLHHNRKINLISAADNTLYNYRLK